MRTILAFIVLVLAGSKADCQVQSFQESEQQFYNQALKKLEQSTQEKQRRYEQLNAIKNSIAELREASKKVQAQFDKENESSYVSFKQTASARTEAKKYSKQNRDLLGRRGYVKVDKSKYLIKSEFETYQQFSDRAQKFLDKRAELIKPHQDSIKQLVKPIKSPWSKNLFIDHRNAKTQYNNSTELLAFAKNSPLKMLSYKDFELVSLDYNAEQQAFTASLKIQDNGGIRLKTYTFKMPASEAEVFKKNIATYDFAFMLGDLRAVIVDKKIIKPEPASSWYTSL